MNIIETNDDVGWQDVDNIFVFDDEPYEDGKISLIYQQMKFKD